MGVGPMRGASLLERSRSQERPRLRRRRSTKEGQALEATRGQRGRRGLSLSRACRAHGQPQPQQQQRGQRTEDRGAQGRMARQEERAQEGGGQEGTREGRGAKVWAPQQRRGEGRVRQLLGEEPLSSLPSAALGQRRGGRERRGGVSGCPTSPRPSPSPPSPLCHAPPSFSAPRTGCRCRRRHRWSCVVWGAAHARWCWSVRFGEVR